MSMKANEGHDINTEIALLKCVDENFEETIRMLRLIQNNIAKYPASIQMGFLKPIKNMVFEAARDSQNENDSYLNQDTANINA